MGEEREQQLSSFSRFGILACLGLEKGGVSAVSFKSCTGHPAGSCLCWVLDPAGKHLSQQYDLPKEEDSFSDLKKRLLKY